MTGRQGQERLEDVIEELFRLAGRPSRRVIETKSSRVAGGPLTRGTVDNILSQKHLPLVENLRVFVDSCLTIAKDDHRLRAGADTREQWIQRAIDAREAAKARDKPRAEDAARLRLVTEHEAWRHVHAEEPGPLRDQAADIARHLDEVARDAESELARRDPWYDADLVRRMSDRVAALIGVLDGEGLWAGEAALLSVVPLAYHLDACRHAAHLVDSVRPQELELAEPPGGDRADFEKRFLVQEPWRRLVSRATTDQELLDRRRDTSEIGWWFYHQWLGSRKRTPLNYLTAELLADPDISTQPVREQLVSRLGDLLRMIRMRPADLRQRERLPLGLRSEEVVFSSRPLRVRGYLVGLLTKLAHALAMELTALPSVVVEHLGIPEPVDMASLQETVRTASWSLGTELTLTASCDHPAVWQALRDHADSVDELVSAAHAAACADDGSRSLHRPLSVRVSTAQIKPSADDAGQPAFETPVNRFRLDEAKIRELLMGPQLYRDPALAIRELYQNALDACRRRRAYHQLQAKQDGTEEVDWPGQISFLQGVEGDTGRPFLECSDNGVGMDVDDLRDAFSRAGSRFVDQAGYLAEQDEFDRHGVKFVPNSRFGIGVMSYFMLADEIQVDTCRMASVGNPRGARLSVKIVGPGHLFRINVGGPEKPGTRVRLYLRDGARAPSCVDLLRRLLGIAEFPVTAEHDGQRETWLPGEFTERLRPAHEVDGIDAGGELVRCKRREDGQVIWCEHGGCLLVDGIYIRAAQRAGALADPSQDGDLRGVVVNLVGGNPPRLSVDRLLVLENVSKRVASLLEAAAPELVNAGREFLRVEWISDVAETSPWVADVVARAASTAGVSLPLGHDQTFDSSRIGCFPPDVELLFPNRHDGDDWAHKGRRSERHRHSRGFRTLDVDHIPDHVGLWRWLAHKPDDVVEQLGHLVPNIASYRDVMTAEPSDALLLANDDDWSADDPPDPDPPPPPGHILQIASHAGVSPRTAADRAALLGMRAVNPERFAPDTLADDHTLLSNQLNGDKPWLTTDRPVSIGHLLGAARQLRIGAEEAALRLIEYGFDLACDASAAIDLPLDIKLASERLDGEFPWLDHDELTPFAHVAKASVKFGLDVAEVGHRLNRLGLRVADRRRLPNRPTDEEFRLISRYCDGQAPWLHIDETVQPGDLIFAARLLGFSPSDVARRLDAFGFTVRGLRDIPDQRDDDLDRQIEVEARRRMEGYLDVDRPVPAIYLAWLAQKVRGRDPQDVAERLARYAFHASDEAVGQATRMDSTDFKLFSKDFDGEPPWIDVTVPVPAAHLVRAALARDDSPGGAARRLAELIPNVRVLGHLPERLTPEDRSLVRRGKWGDEWVDDINTPLSLTHLIRAARRSGLPLCQVAQRLRELGFDVPDLADTVRRALVRIPQRM